jgi:hypothetical protein
MIPLLTAGTAHGQDPAKPSRADVDFFEAKVRPVLVERCFKCHSMTAKKSKGNLLLDGRASILKGGDSGAAAVAGQPDKSLLLRAVSYKDAELSMPPNGKLPDHEIAALAEWVRRGLPFPGPAATAEAKTTIDIDAGRKFWSFQPLQKTAPVAVKQTPWVQRPIDAFILAELEKQRMTPSPAAAPRVLIRRLYFDVIGLPPAPEEVKEFVKAWDAASAKRQAIVADLVEKLLASPRYGERWGRYWLDLARYCDIGEPWTETKGLPHHYRDWVVKAINDDVPYDQFVVKQLAADLLPNPTPADQAALGFIGLSPSYWKELKLAPDVIKSVVAEEWEERIHAVTSTFLGLTVSCARCHDHKFDPITTHDYYALAGIFASTRLADRPVKDFRFLIDDFRLPGRLGLTTFDAAAQAYAIENQKSKIHYVPGVEDASLFVLPDGPHKTKLEYKMGAALDVAMQIRGSSTNLGPNVPRRFLSVLSPGDPRPFKQGSGRLELARAIVTDAAPLSARVIVNRIWKHHFGRGLVETPSDFGAQGDRPTHPQLLDDLAARFIANGWSMKWLHREILLSATYQQESGIRSQESGVRADPDNKWLGRMPRRRLEVEAWRDAMLAVTGVLDRRVGGPAQELGDPKNQRRTLYGTVKRRELSDLLRLHDFPDPTTHSANRVPTITPLQQLYTLNGPLMQQQAAALVKRLQGEAATTDDRIRRAYALLYNRPATAAQLRLAKEFLTPESDTAWQQYAQVLLGSNEFLFVD